MGTAIKLPRPYINPCCGEAADTGFLAAEIQPSELLGLLRSMVLNKEAGGIRLALPGKEGLNLRFRC